jgi:hypothetical protein
VVHKAMKLFCVNKSELSCYEKKWRKLKDMKLNKVNQSEKATDYMISVT